MTIFRVAFSLFLVGVSIARGQQLTGNVSAVYDLLERVLPGSSSHFLLSFSTSCSDQINSAPCFVISDSGDKISISGTGASELTAALGEYFRNWCNMTIGWPRGGGHNMFLPSPWPKIGSPVTRKRIVPWSYIMNVCTHSYSLVWYNWEQWTSFIDWMALSGINLALAMTGQEEVQYKVFSKLGLNDTEIRTWFNGPAFLTWSRGQNEYGSNIAGPLPRSWMQAQWSLQKQILARYRSLGIVGQLPGFQGNVPWRLAEILNDKNITRQGETGWMDSLDPQFGAIADLWMETLVADFGTDHWYQLDGYFNGGTAPWYIMPSPSPVHTKSIQSKAPVSTHSRSNLVNCSWSEPMANTYLAGCSQGCKSFATVLEAKAECVKYIDCGGITQDPLTGRLQLRQSSSPLHSPSKETSYYITNEFECHTVVPYPDWLARGKAAYGGLSRTDPEVSIYIFSFQTFFIFLSVIVYIHVINWLNWMNVLSGYLEFSRLGDCRLAYNGTSVFISWLC